MTKDDNLFECLELSTTTNMTKVDKRSILKIKVLTKRELWKKYTHFKKQPTY